MNEPKPPADLAALQRAFGRTISTPLRMLDEHGAYEHAVAHFDPHAVDAVRPGKLTPTAALSVYNEQYWFRLLTVMQEEFPLTAHLAGVHEFNALVVAYLQAFPPHSARLRDLSNNFVGFLVGHAAAPHVLDAATLDFAFIESFDAPQHPSLDVRTIDLAISPLPFQPHVKLVKLSFNVVTLRRQLRRGEDLDPLRRHAGDHVVWRAGARLHVCGLTQPQASLLARLHAGVPLVDACGALEHDLTAAELEAVLADVQRWFTTWQQRGWFAAAHADL